MKSMFVRRSNPLLWKETIFDHEYGENFYEYYTQVSLESDENGDPVVTLMRVTNPSGLVYKLYQGKAYWGYNLTSVTNSFYAGLWLRKDGNKHLNFTSNY